MMLAYSLLTGSPTEIGLNGCVRGIAVLEDWSD